MRTFNWSLLALPALAFCGPALAAENGFYVGGAISQSQIDGFDESLDIDDTGWKLIAGWRPLDIVSVEMNYMDLGDDSVSVEELGGRVEASALTGYAVLYLPLPFVDIFVKAGLAAWETRGSSSLSLSDFSDEGTDFAYGAGAQVRWKSLAVRGEYESFDIAGTRGLDLFSLGVTWTFF